MVIDAIGIGIATLVVFVWCVYGLCDLFVHRRQYQTNTFDYAITLFVGAASITCTWHQFNICIDYFFGR